MRPSSQQEQLHPSLPPTLFDAIRGPHRQSALPLYAFFYRLDLGVFVVPKSLIWFPIRGARRGVTVAIVEGLCTDSAGTLAPAVCLHHLLSESLSLGLLCHRGVGEKSFIAKRRSICLDSEVFL